VPDLSKFRHYSGRFQALGGGGGDKRERGGDFNNPLVSLMSNLFYLARETGSIYNFRYIAECHRKRLMRIRNNIGAYESVRKLVALSIRCNS
jgi:hypothetical protein